MEILEDPNEQAPMILAAEDTVRIAGNELHLGLVGNHLLSAGIKHWTRSNEGNRGRLTIVPGSTNEFESWRITGRETTCDVDHRFGRDPARDGRDYEDEGKLILVKESWEDFPIP